MPNPRSTIYEVARRSGVSTATVSRAMHGGTGMSETTRNRVLETAAELGWVPDGRARGLATRRSGIVGVLFHDFDSTGETGEDSALYVDQVIRGAESAATAAGDAVLIAATRGRTGRELAFSIAGKVDGLVVIASSISKADLAALSRNLPVVTIANRSRSNPFDDISVDNRGATRAVVDHLVSVHGYTDLVFMAGPPRTPDSSERFAGYRDALRAHGLPAPSSPPVTGGFTVVGGAEAMGRMLADGLPPRAVVCANDEMAIGALRVLRTAKLGEPCARGRRRGPDSMTSPPPATSVPRSPPAAPTDA